MNMNDYIKNRVDVQINWYDNKSKKNKQRYNVLRVIELVASVSITFIVAININSEVSNSINAAIGMVIALIAGLLSLFDFHENWIKYRNTCELLRREKMLFLMHSGLYTDNDEKLFVERIEHLISSENNQWAQTSHERKKQSNN